MSDVSFWSDLERRVSHDGVDAVLADHQQVLDPDIRRALELEAHHLRGWDAAAQPGLLAQQMLTCMYALGHQTRTAEIRAHRSVLVGASAHWLQSAPAASTLRIIARIGVIPRLG